MNIYRRRINDYASRKSAKSSRSNLLPGPREAAGNRLPVELLLQVFVRIPELVDLLQCRTACKQFKQIIDETPEMRYYIELRVLGYEDNDSPALSGASARLEALEARQRWWRSSHSYTWNRENLDWVHFNFITNQYYDNLWLRCNLDTSRLTLDNTAGVGGNEIACMCFEEAEDGTPIVDRWTLGFPFVFDSYVADVPQGRLYLVNLTYEGTRRCFRVRTMSLSHGLLLSDQIFESNIEEEERRLSQFMYCKDNLLALITYAITIGMNTLKIDVTLLDITSGIIVDTYAKTVSGDVQMSFQLITKSCFLFHFMEFGKFITEVYTLLPSPSTRKPVICHISTFEYPEVRLAYVRAVGHNSFTARRLRNGVLARNAPPSPFLRSEATQLLMVHRTYGNSHYALLHCVPILVFTSIVARLRPSKQLPTASVMPWEAWGPHSSRCFLDKDSCVPANFGHRILRPDFTLVDFNRLDIARDLKRAGKAYPKSDRSATLEEKAVRFLRGNRSTGQTEDVSVGANEQIVRHPTVIHNDVLFDRDIVTTLPYRETRLQWNGPQPIFLFGGETWVACTQGEVNGVLGDQAYYVLRREAS